MAWCFSTRASVATVLTTHPCVSRCLRVNKLLSSFLIGSLWQLFKGVLAVRTGEFVLDLSCFYAHFSRVFFLLYSQREGLFSISSLGFSAEVRIRWTCHSQNVRHLLGMGKLACICRISVWSFDNDQSLSWHICHFRSLHAKNWIYVVVLNKWQQISYIFIVVASPLVARWYL